VQCEHGFKYRHTGYKRIKPNAVMTTTDWMLYVVF